MSKVMRLFLVVMLLGGAIALSRLSPALDRAGAKQVAIRDEDFAGSQLPPK